jgi:hypothetical protein
MDVLIPDLRALSAALRCGVDCSLLAQQAGGRACHWPLLSTLWTSLGGQKVPTTANPADLTRVAPRPRTRRVQCGPPQEKTRPAGESFPARTRAAPVGVGNRRMEEEWTIPSLRPLTQRARSTGMRYRQSVSWAWVHAASSHSTSSLGRAFSIESGLCLY